MPREETRLLLMTAPPCNPLYYYLMKAERIINRTHQNTTDSLKAYIVAPFADMPREKSRLT